jgi:hypothetical protein
MRRTSLFVAGYGLAALMLLPDSAHAFGRQGHQIVCAIAMKELKPTAAARVNGLMRRDTQYNTFWEACVWPDTHNRRKPDHYVNVPRATSTIAGASCPIADTCLFTAIDNDAAIIGDRSKAKWQRIEALKYLGHWIGDLHQPLHVSFEDDRGGGKIRTAGLCTDGLHATWDTCMIILREGGGNPNGVATRLRSEISDADRAAWTSGGPADWAKEAYVITLDEQSEYCELANGSCRYDDEREIYAGGERKVVVIDQAYVDANGPIVEKQMKRAGVRLAKLLNDALDE